MSKMRKEVRDHAEALQQKRARRIDWMVKHNVNDIGVTALQRSMLRSLHLDADVKQARQQKFDCACVVITNAYQIALTPEGFCLQTQAFDAKKNKMVPMTIPLGLNKVGVLATFPVNVYAVKTCLVCLGTGSSHWREPSDWKALKYEHIERIRAQLDRSATIV